MHMRWEREIMCNWIILYTYEVGLVISDQIAKYLR
jgi:hypothetical protein